MINSQIHDVEVKINELAAIRDDLRRSLLGLREEELELEDECTFCTFRAGAILIDDGSARSEGEPIHPGGTDAGTDIDECFVVEKEKGPRVPPVRA